MFNHALVLSISLAFCSGAAAQQMYKSVAPDGKITFSDRPALESAARLSVMRSNTLRPVRTSADTVLASADPQPQLTPAAEPAPAVITPQVEAALAQVMAQTEFSRRFYPYCNRTEASARAFSKAAAGWRNRNMAALEQQRKLIMQVVSPAKRSEIQDKVGALLADETAKVQAQPENERVKWCASAVAQLSAASSDIHQPEMMAVPLTAFKSR